MGNLPEINRIVEALRERGIDKPEAAVILGSGLGAFSESLKDTISIPYDEIPGMPGVSVIGHSGTFNWGKTATGKKVLAFGGRFHSYEGHEIDHTLIPVRIAHAIGTRKLLISNAAGSVNYNFRVGDLMLINDFFSPCFPMAPKGSLHLSRFDMAQIRSKVLQIAAGLDIHLQHGTYCYMQGPTYETKAEIRAFRKMGADVVGMSTAPELIEATSLGLTAVGISLVTNMSTGVTNAKLDHAEVKEAAETRKDDFARLVLALIDQL